MASISAEFVRIQERDTSENIKIRFSAHSSYFPFRLAKRSDIKYDLPRLLRWRFLCLNKLQECVGSVIVATNHAIVASKELLCVASVKCNK
jgi:hypothetical protein